MELEIWLLSSEQQQQRYPWLVKNRFGRILNQHST